MIYTSLDNFYLGPDELENSPSRKDGIDRDTEQTLRMYGCELIQEGGCLLGFDQVVMATGQVLFHRFYCKRSMKAFNVKVRARLALRWLLRAPTPHPRSVRAAPPRRSWRPRRCGRGPSLRRCRT